MRAAFRHRTSVLIVVLATTVTALAVRAAPSASAATATQAIANLNAQRAANGIPAGITENPASSAACAAHNNYERTNGGTLIHSETPGAPGYSVAGDQAAGSSVLAAGLNWDTVNPWENAPIHLAQLLDPYLAQMGVDDSDGYVCATTLPPDAGFRANPAGIFGYSYPGNEQVGWPTSETAAEGPFTPGDLVGLPQPTRTGPYLFVLFAGPWSQFDATVTLTAESLVGPAGSVAITAVDGNTPTPEGIPLGRYIGSAAMVIPTKPLSGGATYTAQVEGSVAYDGITQPLSEHFSFTTAISAAALRAESHLRLSKANRQHGSLVFTLTGTGVYAGRSAQVRVTVGRKLIHRYRSKLIAKRSVRVPHQRHATVSVSVPAFTTDGVRFATITVKRSA